MLVLSEQNAACTSDSSEHVMDKKTLIIGQIMMTFLMAATMSGIMLLVMVGPVSGWLGIWGMTFLIAWPIAFFFTQIYSRIAFPLAARLRQSLK